MSDNNVQLFQMLLTYILTMDISFIIPTKNESYNILNIINSIKKNTPIQYKYEIIVVDNYSDDNTVCLAQKGGAHVIIQKNGFVSSLRNHGRTFARGEVLIFLDGDVLLTSMWRMNIVNSIEQLKSNKKIITGSTVGISQKPSWLEKVWFKYLNIQNSNYINSGHLIINNRLFDELGGFAEYLETGEDYDLSRRAKNIGASIIDNHLLNVSHEGFPKHISEFIFREMWHGKGDFSSFHNFIESKVALISISFLLFHILMLYSLIFMNFFYFMISFISITFICMFSSFVKFNNAPLRIKFINSFMFYIYFLSRSLSSIFVIMLAIRYKISV